MGSASTKTPDNYFKDGLLNYYFRKYNDAYSSIESAIHLDRGNRDAWLLHGSLMFRKYQDKGALFSFKIALKLDPTTEFAWNEPGLREGLKTILKFEQKTKEIVHLKGCILSRQKKYTAAITAFKEALEIDPNYQASWSEKAFASEKLGNYENAIADI